MLNKHSLLFIALLCTTQLYAAVPIESRGLSQSSSYNNASTATPTVNSNPTWDLVQKNQNLENDIRTLRGQLEEQANEIDQLKKRVNKSLYRS
jgi:peptidoglycan hydrolase CwlO-like protein